MILGGRGKAEPYDALAAAFEPGDRAYLIGEAAGDLAAALEPAHVPYVVWITLEDAVDGSGASRLTRRRRPPLAGLRLVRPVHELRAPRGGVPPPGAEALRVTRTRRADRGQLEQKLLILVTLGLVAFGLVMVFSATSASAALGEGDPMRFLVKQGLYAVVGLVLLAVLTRVDYHALRPLAPLLLVGAFVACVGVLVLGPSINGAHRWFIFGPVSVQPAEFAKLARLRLGVRRARPAGGAADDGRADEAGRPRRLPLRGR